MHWAKNSQFLYVKYRIYSINRPGRLLNFLDLESGRLLSVVCLFCNKTVNGNNKTRRCNKARFCKYSEENFFFGEVSHWYLFIFFFGGGGKEKGGEVGGGKGKGVG